MYDDKKPAKPDHKRQKSFERTVKLANMVIAGNSYLASHARNFSENVEILPTGLNVSECKDNICRPDGGKVRLVWRGRLLRPLGWEELCLFTILSASAVCLF